MAHSSYFWDSIPANQCLVDWIITGLIVHVCASRIISCIQTLQLQIQLMCRLNMMLCLFYLCCNIITSYQSAATSVIIKHHGHGPSLVYAVLFRPLPSQLSDWSIAHLIMYLRQSYQKLYDRKVWLSDKINRNKIGWPL